MYEKFCQKLWHLYIQATGVKPTRNPVIYRHLSDDQACNSALGHCSQYFARLRIWNSKEAYFDRDGDRCVFDHVFSSLEKNVILSDLTHLNSRMTNLGPSILCFNNDYDGTLKRFLIRNYLGDIEISAKYESKENMNYKRDGMIVNNSRFTKGNMVVVSCIPMLLRQILGWMITKMSVARGDVYFVL